MDQWIYFGQTHACKLKSMLCSSLLEAWWPYCQCTGFQIKQSSFELFSPNMWLLFPGLDYKMSLPEICENAKMAREYALLGNYDTSLVYYQGVIQQIQKHIQQLKDDAIMKQEWHQVRNNTFIWFSWNFQLSSPFVQILLQYHNTKNPGLQYFPELPFLKCWQKRWKMPYLLYALPFRYVSQLSKSMTKWKKSIKLLQISRRIQYTLEGPDVHMKRNLPGTQMCGQHPLQWKETTGIQKCHTIMIN